MLFIYMYGSNLDALLAADIPAGTNVEDANRAEGMPLEDGRHRRQFVVDDIMGGSLTSDCGIFETSGGEARLVEVQQR